MFGPKPPWWQWRKRREWNAAVAAMVLRAIHEQAQQALLTYWQGVMHRMVSQPVERDESEVN